MKKWLLALLLLPSWSTAQRFDVDVRRTVETPGFFLVHIAPKNTAQVIKPEPLFVTHFEGPNADAYRELLPILKELGAKIISHEDLSTANINSQQQVIVLGTPVEDFLSFEIQKGIPVLEQFEHFTEEYLQPVLLNDLEIQTGGNVFEIYPSDPQQITHLGLTLIGKFQRPMKTRMVLKGSTSEGSFTQILDVPLQKIDLARGWEAQNLPRFWEEAYRKEHPPVSIPSPAASVIKTPSSSFALQLEDWFPWILAGAGVLLLWVGGRWALRSKSPHEILEEAMERNQWPHDSNLPFTVETKAPDPQNAPDQPGS